MSGRIPVHAAVRALRAVVLAGALQAAAGDATPEAEGFVDLHAHAAGIGAGGSGVFIGRAMRDSFRFPIYLRAFGVSRNELEKGGDAVVIDRIAAHVAASERVERAVVLALDGVVDTEGNLDREATQVYVPNDFVARETARHPQLCFGASVNPYRHDALERLARVRDAGAVLVKWIPNIMGTDWPLQFFPLVSPYYHLNRIGFAEARSAAALDNPWDRDVAVKEALHVPQHVFARGAELLPMERCYGSDAKTSARLSGRQMAGTT